MVHVYIRVKIIIKPNVQKLVTSNRLKTFSTGGNEDNELSSTFGIFQAFCLKYKCIYTD